MKALAALLCGALLVAVGSCDPKPKDHLIPVASDDQGVNAAMDQARANLPAFWSAYDKAASKQGFTMKVKMPTRAGGAEHIWIKVTGRQGDQITGLLDNEPVDIEGVALGSKVSVKTDQVTDWAYPKDGRYFGHFTTRALMNRASPQDQAIAQKMLWPTPLEAPAR